MSIGLALLIVVVILVVGPFVAWVLALLAAGVFYLATSGKRAKKLTRRL